MSQFTGIITDTFKSVFNDAIDEVISSLSRTCQITYPTTKWIACTACEKTVIGNRGPNPFINGGNGTHTGSCPVCSGSKKISVPNRENIDLAVIWDYKDFFNVAGSVVYPEGMVQTVCNISEIEKLKKADYIIFNTSITQHANHKFIRDGEPTPVGLGSDRYIVVNWKKQ